MIERDERDERDERELGAKVIGNLGGKEIGNLGKLENLGNLVLPYP